MYVETMTSDELFAEYEKDCDDIAIRAESKIYNSKEYKRLRRSSSSVKFPVALSFEITTQRNNKYVISSVFPDRKTVFAERYNTCFSAMSIINTKYGIMGMTFNTSSIMGIENRKWVLVIKPHAFVRYKERMKYTDCEGIEIVKRFIERNYSFITDYSYRGKSNNEVFMACKDGGLLGEIIEGKNTYYYNMKTFIANDTMQDGYKSLFNDSSSYNIWTDSALGAGEDSKEVAKIMALNKR